MGDESCPGPLDDESCPGPPDVASEPLLGIWRQQEAAVAALRRELANCRHEVGSLHDCLIERGVIDDVRFLVHLHRRRFEAARSAYGLSLDVRFDSVMDVQSVAQKIATFVGPMAVSSLRAASSTIRPIATDVLGALCPGHIYVCGGFEGSLALNSVERLDPLTGLWEALPPMTEARQYTCAGVVSGWLYVCGGWGGPQPVASVERFDPLTATWATMPPMLHARWGASAGVVNGKLHVCGGLDESRQPLNSVERFDPMAVSAEGSLTRWFDQVQAEPWQTIASMAERRGWPAAGVLGGLLYVCGGRDEQREPLSSVERLNPSAPGGWEPLTSMAAQRAGAAAAAASGRLYVCGGAFGSMMLSSAERFDPKANGGRGAWESLPSMAGHRAYVAVAGIAGQVYVFGGSDGAQCMNSTERLQPVADAWVLEQPMSERRSGAAAVTVLAT